LELLGEESGGDVARCSMTSGGTEGEEDGEWGRDGERTSDSPTAMKYSRARCPIDLWQFGVVR